MFAGKVFVVIAVISKIRRENQQKTDVYFEICFFVLTERCGRNHATITQETLAINPTTNQCPVGEVRLARTSLIPIPSNQANTPWATEECLGRAFFATE